MYDDCFEIWTDTFYIRRFNAAQRNQVTLQWFKGAQEINVMIKTTRGDDFFVF